MDNWDFFMAMVFGMAGYLVAAGVAKMTDGSKAKLRFRNQNERVLSLIHQLVDNQNERALIETEIAHILEKEPVDRALWIARIQETAAAIPPIVMQQLQRFGLAVPPPEGPPAPKPEPVIVERDIKPENVIAMDVWTGRKG